MIETLGKQALERSGKHHVNKMDEENLYGRGVVPAQRYGFPRFA
jgi:hypothetical protein